MEEKQEFLDKEGLKKYHELLNSFILAQKLKVDNDTIIEKDGVISANINSASSPHVIESSETLVF